MTTLKSRNDRPVGVFETVLAVIFLPFLGAALAPLVYRLVGERTAYYAASVAAVTLGLVTRLYLSGVWRGGVTYAADWVPSLGLRLAVYADGLAMLIAFLASGVGVLVLTYSGGYMHGEPGQAKYYAVMLAFMGSMLGVAFAGDLFALFTFWELTSLASFLLIGHYTTAADSQYAARKSMLVTVAGGLFMLAGFLLVAWAGETTLIAGEGSLLATAPAVTARLREAGLLVPALGLVGIGAATKSAQVPFHIWLPDAMEAPTPVSAFLHSATMVKAGVYLLGRFRPFFLGESGLGVVPEWSVLLVTLGLVTMTVTAALAVASTDIKQLLAYSTASHLGLITAGFGAANKLGAETGAFHVLNHASFKAALFLVAGIIAHEAGTREIDRLRGLWRDLPVTAVVAGLASLSMAGLPPFNGFYSKELLFEATYEVGHEAGGAAWLFPVVAVIGSVFTFLYSIKFLSLFLGDRPEDLHVHRPPVAMVAPAGVLGTLVVIVSVSPQLAIDTIVGGVFGSTIVSGEPTFTVGLPTELKPAVVMSAITIGVGAVLWPQYDRLHDAIRRLLWGRPTAPTGVSTDGGDERRTVADADDTPAESDASGGEDTTGGTPRPTVRDPAAARADRGGNTFLRADWWYDAGVAGLGDAGRAAADRVQTGLLRTYAIWAVLATAALALGGYVFAAVEVPAPTLGAGVTLALAVVVVTAAIGAVAVAASPSHIAGVLTLSIVGFTVAVFYVLADAPDLALTQLVVETLLLVLFLLVLNRLPAYYGQPSVGRALRDGAVAVVVGGTVFLTVVLATAASPQEPVAEILVERANLPPGEHGAFFTEYGGGSNVVNVILVDLRALDTLGEVSVVAMAALAVLTLIRMRGRGGENA